MRDNAITLDGWRDGCWDVVLQMLRDCVWRAVKESWAVQALKDESGEGVDEDSVRGKMNRCCK